MWLMAKIHAHLDAVPVERIRRLTLRKAIRGGRIDGRRRIHHKHLAAAVGLAPEELSRLLSGDHPLTPQRWRMLMAAITTLTGGPPASASTK